MENRNFEMEMLQTQILEQTRKTPFGKYKVIRCMIIPTTKYVSNINQILETYPNAYFKGVYLNRFVYFPVKGYISKSDIDYLNLRYGYVSLIVVLEIRGTSTNLVDKLRPSNWFLNNKSMR